MTEYEEVIKKIQNYEYGKIDKQELINTINKYFDNSPTKTTITRNTIHLTMTENKYTNITMQKLEKLLYHLHDGDIVIPIHEHTE